MQSLWEKHLSKNKIQKQDEQQNNIFKIVKNMENQKEITKAWAKMELNSSYGFPPIPVIPMEYDENKALHITEEGKKNLIVIMEALKNVL
jgi:hypothetical protein